MTGHGHPKSARISGPFGAVFAGCQIAEPGDTEQRSQAVRFLELFLRAGLFLFFIASVSDLGR